METKNLTALVIDNGLFVSFALRIAPAFKHLMYFSPWVSAFPKSNSLLPGDGFDEMERVKNLFEALEKADLIIFFDVYYGDFQEWLEEHGKIVWGCRTGEVLELNRMRSKKMLKAMGIQPSPAVAVRGLASLRDYLKDNENVYVKISCNRGDFETFHAPNYELVEPKLDQLEHDLGAKKLICEFVVEESIEPADEWGIDAFTIDGQWPVRTFSGWESKDVSFVGRVMEWDEIPQYLRAPNEKLSPYFKEVRYRGFFSTELRVTPEKNTYLIDPCCFSEDTEILTDAGWKRFDALNRTEKVATLNPLTREIEYHRPSDYIGYQFDGDMVSLSNRRATLDLMVTPNHAVWAINRNGLLVDQRADELAGHLLIPRSGAWLGESPLWFVVPEYSHSWVSGKDMGIRKTKFCPAVRIEISLWLKFLAFFLSEGHSDEHMVTITQTKFRDDFRKVISKLPFQWTENEKGFRIFSVQLVSYLSQFGKRHERGIPSFVKGLSPRLIDIFLDAYVLGDGLASRFNRVCTTTSKQTADDLQELFLKSGHCANIAVVAKAGEPVGISGGKYTTKHDSYEIREQIRDFYLTGWNSSRSHLYLRKSHYCGMVYDVTVQNHIIYVRRNGKPCWSGNCRLPSPPNEIQQMVFDNWAEVIAAGAHGEMVEPHTVFKYGVCAMIHSSFADKNWQAIRFPEEVRPFVKLRNHCRIDGVDYVVPQAVGLPEVGAVIGLGDSLQEAVDHLKENAEQVEGYYLEVKTECVQDVDKVIEAGEKLGIQL